MTNKIERIKEVKPAVKTEYSDAQNVNTLSFKIIGGKDVMPIGGWWGPYHNKDTSICDLSDEIFYKEIADCGVNFITVSVDDFASHEDYTFKALKLSAKYNLGFFVHDTEFVKMTDSADMKNRISLFEKYPSFVGMHVLDEPIPDKFDEIARIYNLFDSINRNDLLLYTNLFPSYGQTIFEKFNIDYNRYIADFMRKVNTRFLSYDYYPFYFKGEGTGGAKKYFANLSLCKKYADEYGVPLWGFLQAGGQWQCVGKKSIDYYPTEEEMRWNASTCLAFGVKCLQYFTLIQPEEYTGTDNGMDCRRIGLIGFDGLKNRWYDYAKNINAHIANVDEVLMNSRCVGVIPCGSFSEDVLGEEYAIKTFKELKSVSGGDSITGCFEDAHGKTVLYVVNNSVIEDCDAVLHFEKDVRVDFYCGTDSFSAVCREPALHLSAGEGILIKLH